MWIDETQVIDTPPVTNGHSTLIELVPAPPISRFAKRLKKARIEAGWSQGQLGAKVKLPQSAISQIENGRRDPSARLVAYVLKVWGVKP